MDLGCLNVAFGLIHNVISNSRVSRIRMPSDEPWLDHLLASCVTLGRLCNFFILQFPLLWNVGNKIKLIALLRVEWEAACKRTWHKAWHMLLLKGGHCCYWITLIHRWQTQGPRAESSPPPCFYLAAAPSSLPLVKEQLHSYSPKVTFGPLRPTARLMWPPVKMSLAPLL